MSKPANPPLFVQQVWEGSTKDRPDRSVRTDITLRDIFAGMAMAAHIQSSTAQGYGINDTRDKLARHAYKDADALLEAREA